MKILIIVLVLFETSSYGLSQKDLLELQSLVTPFSNLGAQTMSPGSQLVNLPPMERYNKVSLIGVKISNLIEGEKIPSHLRYLKMLKDAYHESVEKNNLTPLKEMLETVKMLIND